MQERSVSIRYSLLLNFLMIIFILSGAIIATTYLGNQQTVHKLSAELIVQTLDRTESELKSFFGPVMRQLLLIRDWAASGILDADKPEFLRQISVPLLREYNQISTLLIADSRGREFMLLKLGPLWRSRLVKRDIWNSKVRWTEWYEGEKTQRLHSEELDYDPRKRPWFRGAVAEYQRRGPLPTGGDLNKYVHWTAPYNFYTSGEPGLSASIQYYLKDGLVGVLALDVLLTEISLFTSTLKVSDHGKVVILTDEPVRRVIGLPSDEKYRNTERLKADLLKEPQELALSPVGDAIKSLEKAKVYTSAHQIPIHFKSNGKTWLVGLRKFKLSEQRSLWIMALVPEDDLVGDLGRLRLIIIAVTLTVIGIAIYRGIVLARRVGSPIEVLMRQSERISRGLLYEGAPVESSIIEVQRLADAHERMRVALKSLIKLESDLQLARQIQQSTFPKKFAVLSGFDVAAWSQPAEDTGGDTYDVIGFNVVGEQKTVVLTDDHPHHAMLLMADATGHGIGPALSANEVRAMLRMAVRSGETLSDIAANINDQLCQDLHAGRFITTWLGIIDTSKSTLTQFSAGQAPLIYFIAQQQRFEVGSAHAPPFGIIRDLDIEIDPPREMAKGDLFAVLSDGIFEAVNDQKEQFGLKRVLPILEQNANLSCHEILLRLRHALDAFMGEVPANDDRTVILIKKT